MRHDDRHDQLVPAQGLIADGLGAIGGDLGRIVAAWPQVVGDRLARVSTPSRLTDQTLSVRCASASWAQSLNGNELDVLDRLAARVGDGVVTRIVARAGGPAPRVEVEPPAPLEQDVDPATRARLEAMVAGIDDPQLRARMLAAAIATGQRRAMRSDP